MYLYLILCGEADVVHAKVGIATDPVRRVRALRTGLPLRIGLFAVCETPGRPVALKIEKALHRALARWNERAEWFALSLGDKIAFNEACRRTFAVHAMTGWRFGWEVVSLDQLDRAAKERAGQFRAAMRRASQAEIDFRSANN